PGRRPFVWSSLRRLRQRLRLRSCPSFLLPEGALAEHGLQPRDVLAHLGVLIRPRALAGGGLDAEIELLAAQLQKLLAELRVGFRPYVLYFHHTACRSTKVVPTG